MAKKVEIEEKEIEAPYELPEGWKWVRLGDFIDIYRGVSYKKTDAHSEKLQNDCLIMRGGNIEEGKINTDADNVYVDKSIVAESQFIKKNDVIIVTSTGSTKVIGRAGISNANYSDVAFGAFLTLARPNEKADKAFVNNYFQSPLYRERIRQLASGVNINNIRADYITESPFPLPPTIEEQQRIVNRIESMFAKLDEAKEKAQNVVDCFETRKAAILHQAFTGNLTEKWRKENGVSDDSWVEKSIEDLSELITKGASPKWQGVQYVEDSSQTLFVTSENVRNGYLDFEKEKYLDNKINEIQKRSVLKKGDVLVNIVGASIGRAAIFNIDKLANTNQAVCIVRLKSDTDNEFLCYYLNSNFAKLYYDANKVETARANISLKDISEMPMKICTLDEQQEIVRILDTVLEKERTAKSAAEQVLEQIDLLKKSILARAFRGEL